MTDTIQLLQFLLVCGVEIDSKYKNIHLETAQTEKPKLISSYCFNESSNKKYEKVFIKNCPVAENPVNNYLKTTDFKNRPFGRCHIFGSEKAIPDFSIALPQEKTESIPKNKKIKHYIKPKYQGITIDPKTCVTVELCGKKIMFDIKGFFQSNLEVLEIV